MSIKSQQKVKISHHSFLELMMTSLYFVQLRVLIIKNKFNDHFLSIH